MNATLIMAFILILIVVATVITKKLPFNFVLFIAPVLCALILGHSIEETSTFIVEQLASMMKSAGFMLLFAFLYFQMLSLQKPVYSTRSFPLSQQNSETR